MGAPLETQTVSIASVVENQKKKKNCHDGYAKYENKLRTTVWDDAGIKKNLKRIQIKTNLGITVFTRDGIQLLKTKWSMPEYLNLLISF